MTRTFGSIMADHQGVGPGFDLTRLGLATSVMIFHCFQLSYGRNWSAGPFEAPVMLLVPGFFALSGFLVTGSMARNANVRNFLIFRTLRIVPALTGVTVLSAFVLGPLVTTRPLSAYFADPTFAHYFTNIIAIIRYGLPGVFPDNPLAGIVNGQLWTVPSELHCYTALAVLALLRLSLRPIWMLCLFLFLSTAECATAFLPHHHYTARVLNSEEMLVMCFLCGNVFYLWRDKIPASKLLFGLSVTAYVAVTFWIPTLGFILGSAAATYFVVYLGTRRPPRIPLLMTGDYSYGIYLYSFPIQQAVAWGFPDQRTWYFNLLVNAPVTLLFAALSWHWLERPALSLRKRLAPRALLVSADR